jgi:UDP-2,4-diacetamido-2,4,6-trideoxy-beta-L-altropyranose hydrolase
VSTAGTLFIRADASRQMGSGHVMRCLALAEAAQEAGMAVHFLCRPLAGDLVSELRQRQLPLTLLDLPEGPGLWQADDLAADARASLAAIQAQRHLDQHDWLLVDHYQLGAPWHLAVAHAGLRIAVLDDLANRPLACTLLIDQNALSAHHHRYPSLTPAHCQHLLGPRYTLLRQEIRQAAQQRLSTPPSTTVVFLGGADTDRLTERVLDRLAALPQAAPTVQVLCGAMNPHWRAVQARCEAAGHRFALASRDMATLFAQARLAVVACGMTALELQALGIPSLLVPLSGIQEEVALDFARRGRAAVRSPQSLSDQGAFDTAWQALLAMPHHTPEPGFIALDGARRVIAQMQDLAPCRPT